MYRGPFPFGLVAVTGLLLLEDRTPLPAWQKHSLLDVAASSYRNGSREAARAFIRERQVELMNLARGYRRATFDAHWFACEVLRHELLAIPEAERIPEEARLLGVLTGAE